ncbi:uncharacterized protein LOC131148030 [Malania oleifera]|uniref:uncharacterized protein LOC131148030 n=1 Tax=Malania oleifera TaxID=397392 RepID=UPI0025AEC1BF|nr:uncharacterized protein LOC131148030 [Malania oleifera]
MATAGAQGMEKDEYKSDNSLDQREQIENGDYDARGQRCNGASKKPKRRKKKNLFEVVQFLPNWGIGYHMAKTHWTGVSYEITKINLYKDGRHGKAWGIVHKEGLPAPDTPKKINGVHKRCWRYIPNAKKAEESTEKPKCKQKFDSILLFPVVSEFALAVNGCIFERGVVFGFSFSFSIV